MICKRRFAQHWTFLRVKESPVFTDAAQLGPGVSSGDVKEGHEGLVEFLFAGCSHHDISLKTETA